MDKKEEKEAKDFSTAALCIALGFALGGVLFVPISKFLPEAFQTSIEVNGQFGDFIGGLLNPVIALLAFVWLRKGVIAQREELSATKTALDSSATAQSTQVQIGAVTAMLQVLTVRMNVLDTNLDRIRGAMERTQQLQASEPRENVLGAAMRGEQTYLEKKQAQLRRDYQLTQARLIEAHDQQVFYFDFLKTLAPEFAKQKEDEKQKPSEGHAP
ncbi:hypothetical protein [Pseudorhodoferax sp. Leaf265]|uniref:hypothetical protein n=1 Tax=Pseudorhodoferax sp. Leaf265 TaxID=1736315 RepID=UPI0006F5A231|nr:hypothetical protein [Pseudorhodoferax sp. Leaf265]KQP02470.1 hypothetical protein ASF45_20665 [Pseudorhodoferax sp. Leaf265]